MAENNGNHFPDEPTSTRHEFPEVNGKTVELVELVVEPDFYGITIRFTDKTSLSFVMEPCVFAFPVHEDWNNGESKILKQYPPIRSKLSTE